MERHDERRLSELMDRIGHRLRDVCASWEEERFQALVRQMAQFELRWQDRERDSFSGRG